MNHRLFIILVYTNDIPRRNDEKYKMQEISTTFIALKLKPDVTNIA